MITPFSTKFRSQSLTASRSQSVLLFVSNRNDLLVEDRHGETTWSRGTVLEPKRDRKEAMPYHTAVSRPSTRSRYLLMVNYVLIDSYFRCIFTFAFYSPPSLTSKTARRISV